MLDLSRETVLVTGGSGFLGTQVVAELRRQGAAPITCSRRQFDLTVREQCQTLFWSYKPTVVIHCAAAVGGIQANQREPGRFFRDNLLMGVNVVDCCREFDVRKVCCVGTVCSYPKLCPVPFHTSDFWSGYPEETNAGYGVSKKTLLTMLECYRAQYGLEFAYPVLANLYGPRDQFAPEASHVIPALVRKFVEAVESGSSNVEVWGDGTASREFLFVRDAARAAVECLASGAGLVNVGTGIETSIAELAALIAELTGFYGEIKWNTDRPNGQPRRQLGDLWPLEPVSLRDGLAETIEWYRALSPVQEC